MADLNFTKVNRSPHRYFSRKHGGSGGGASGASSGGTSAASSTDGTTYIMLLLDMSGSNSAKTRVQLENLITFLSSPAGSKYKVFVWCFGIKAVTDPIYGRMGKEWAPLRKLDTYFSNRVVRSGGNRNYVSYFPWPTYTNLIKPALRAMNDFVYIQSRNRDTPIAFMFMGDGAFSDGNFIRLVKEAKSANHLNRITSFTSVFACNTADLTQTNLTRQLQTLLMTTDSAISFASHKLSTVPGDLCRVIKTINTGGTVAPPGYSSILDETFHDFLTPGSIATILKANKGLIGKYISFIVDHFEKCPIVFTSETNLIGKIYKALIILSHFDNDKFSIKMYLMNRMSVLADKKDFLEPQRKAAIKLLGKQDNSAFMLAREKLEGFYTGRFISISGLPVFDFDDIIRDGSCSKLINLLDAIWSEHSTASLTETSSIGIPILRDDASPADLVTSFKMCTGLFGVPETVLGSNTMLVIAMYILTSDCVEGGDRATVYLKNLCHRFIFNDLGTLRRLVFKSDGAFHDNMYCAGYARILYKFMTTFGDGVTALTKSDVSNLRDIYTAICKIIVWRRYSYDIEVPKLTFDFHIGDLVLISPKSWGSGECPLINMPNLAMIIPSVASDRSHHPHKYKCQFTEGRRQGLLLRRSRVSDNVPCSRFVWCPIHLCRSPMRTC